MMRKFLLGTFRGLSSEKKKDSDLFAMLAEISTGYALISHRRLSSVGSIV
jgi:hypothetical protein